MLRQHIENLKEEPMSDSSIEHYLGIRCNILIYSELKKYKKIDNILPNEKSFIFLLYEDGNEGGTISGHWCLLYRLNNIIWFFDPYGGAPDTQLEWVPKEVRYKLGITRPYLTDLFNNSSLRVNYSSFEYQKEGEDDEDINTCGRHCCFCCKNMLINNYDLRLYHDLMVRLKKKMKCSYDAIVSLFCPF